MTAHLTKQLGMAPGGEFRTAFREVNTKVFFNKYLININETRLEKFPVVM